MVQGGQSLEQMKQALDRLSRRDEQVEPDGSKRIQWIHTNKADRWREIYPHIQCSLKLRDVKSIVFVSLYACYMAVARLYENLPYELYSVLAMVENAVDESETR